MRLTSLVAALLGGALFAGCAAPPPARPPWIQVSADYAAEGNATGVRAFVYGKRTILVFDRRPLRLTVHDANGVPVAYEREGPYYRLARRLDRFTVWTNASVLSFRRTGHAAPARTEVPLNERAQPEREAPSLAPWFAAQQDEVRRMIAMQASSKAEADLLMARLNRVEAQHRSGVSTMVRMQFEAGANNVLLDDDRTRLLIAAALAAQQINIEGHTDAYSEGPNDLGIALERARVTREFLIAHGVDGRKIRLAARPAGDFIVPLNTEQGRALNRRAEIELLHRCDED